MFTIAAVAAKDPDRPALIFENGESCIRYGELERSSRRLAALLRRWGILPGDGVAVLVGNEEPFYRAYWAAMRSGLYFTPINWHLTASEIRYILENSDAKVFLASSAFGSMAAEAARDLPSLRKISLNGAVEGFHRYEEVETAVPDDPPLEEQLEGAHMLYSSGTTGLPKAVRAALSGRPAGDPGATAPLVAFAKMFGFHERDRYLSPAPLYHSAPLVFTVAQHRIGATAVVMRRFDAERSLQIIQDQRITTSQWVPTMFRRLLQLPEDVRHRYDLSSHRLAIHAAAPCPVPVKRAMIEWWGPILAEYYGGTEGGGTLIHSEEWLAHLGSVGRHWMGGKIHILDGDGNEIDEPRREGTIYFDAPRNPKARFAYYKDPEKTRASYQSGRFTLGDVGFMDEDGYLYLTDRKSNMIISGGVNIYPQETENLLLTHAKVEDVAVIGVPNEDLGEEVKAVVVPAPGVDPGPGLERELIEFCRIHIAHYKCPRTIDFEKELPRYPTGKLYKRRIRERYWAGRKSRLA